MNIEFQIRQRSDPQTNRGHHVVYLLYDNWDDYSFKTLFLAVLVRPDGTNTELGSVKIARVGQPKGRSFDELPASFTELPDVWFSVGQDVEYYKKLCDALTFEERDAILTILGDVAFNPSKFQLAENENVFITSLTRSVSVSAILGQYRRILRGEVELTDFNFHYRSDGGPFTAPVNLEFEVKAASTPSTNIHVVIGRNGVGKTTLLNQMTRAVLQSADVRNNARFVTTGPFGTERRISKTYFSSLISVSFSGFDPFVPPADQPDRTKETAYFYVGMKKVRAGEDGFEKAAPKSDAELREDLVGGLISCLRQPEKRKRWLNAIARLESDINFAEMALSRLTDANASMQASIARNLSTRMSSGHAIVLLTITKLVELVEEKTLVLMDEPESHLHPPLLSALTRSLSDLLHDRNGVAIVATHSPVVAQEVPRTCVWKLTRLGSEGRSDRPVRETFGENVGILTHEIFGLEVQQSGFHNLLRKAVDEGGSYDSIVQAFGAQLGHEARAILLAMVSARDQKAKAFE